MSNSAQSKTIMDFYVSNPNKFRERFQNLKVPLENSSDLWKEDSLVSKELDLINRHTRIENGRQFQNCCFN